MILHAHAFVLTVDKGWLNAQAAAKTKTNKPLPKGLAKKTAIPARPATTTRTNSTPAIKVTPKPVKKEAEAAEEGDDWGDAWG